MRTDTNLGKYIYSDRLFFHRMPLGGGASSLRVLKGVAYPVYPAVIIFFGSEVDLR